MLRRLRAWLGLERRALDDADPALASLTGGLRTSSGEPVTPDRAVGLTAVWACVTLIAGTLAALPLLLYRRLPDETRERAVDHPLFAVLHQRPNPVQNLVAFWEAMIVALLLRGNAYATFTRDDEGRVRALWYLHPDRVRPEVLRSGRLRYHVATPEGRPQILPQEQMLHVVGPLSDDGYTGRSVIATFRETLGLGLAAERYGAEFFANAATPRGVLTTPGRLSDHGAARLRAAVDEAHAARGRRHKTLILEEGVTFQPIGIKHDDAQFVELRRFTTEEVARIFGVPPHMIGGDVKGSMTYSNSELEALRLLKHTLAPWMARLTSAIEFACLTSAERRTLYVEYLPDALLATDTAGRYQAYRLALEAGFLTVEEVRRRENLPALPAPTVP